MFFQKNTIETEVAAAGKPESGPLAYSLAISVVRDFL